MEVTKEDEKYIKVSIHMKVDGNIIRQQEKTYYTRGRETFAFTLDDFARIVFMYDKIFSPHATYLYDGILQEMEKKLPSPDGETAESLFQKYWVNLKGTIDEDFAKRNKGEGKDEYALFPEENDYLRHSIEQKCNSFLNSPMPVKYAFLHWFSKYVLNGSVEEYKAELANIPDSIKTIVDEMVEENKKRAETKTERV